MSDFLPSVEDALSWFCVVVTVASVITAMTKTPAPGSKLAKAYKVIEILGLVVGRAKHDGYIKTNEKAEAIGKDIIDVARTMAAPAEQMLSKKE